MAQDEEALALQTLRRAIELEPGSADAWNNLGAMDLDCARPPQAQAAYAEAIRRAPEQAAAQFGLALACLMQGDFERGWPQYEWRWLGASQSRPDQRPRFACPQWQGQGVAAAASIVVYHEQGFGDTVQFLRFVPALAQRFGAVVLVVQPGLLALARHNLPAGIEVLSSEQGQQAVRERRFDWHCPLGSLPLALGLRDPARIPGAAGYLRVPPGWRAPAAFDTLRQEARVAPRPQVGLCWAGNPDLAHDKSRSVALAALRGLIAGHDLGWVSLQKQRSAADAELLHSLGVLDLSAELGDFTDTAAVIAGLDLVISVDTVITHLAGALGCPCWLLNRHQSEWRWMHGSNDSVWYRSLRQFRQPRRKDWAGVLTRLDAALAETFGRRRASPIPPGDAP
jgi:tetratricopeptide (TPR) repeat protein